MPESRQPERDLVLFVLILGLLLAGRGCAPTRCLHLYRVARERQAPSIREAHR